jgi:putative FmdB family regulatory protein
MPAYEYVCLSCGKDFIIFLSIKEYETNPKIKCDHCQSDKVSKKLTAFYTKTSKKS